MQKGIDKLLAGSKIYFIGVGGISMSGLALLAQGYGFEVGGSDMNPSERTEMLASKGIKIYNTQVEENLIEFKPDYIVKTAAILPTNKEVKYALDNDITIFDRSEFLGLITESYKQVINVSGTHGKTTTTSMLSVSLSFKRSAKVEMSKNSFRCSASSSISSKAGILPRHSLALVN